jgi:hypothetical protein
MSLSVVDESFVLESQFSQGGNAILPKSFDHVVYY